MFWLGVATLLMMISGSGDDTRAFRMRATAMKQALAELVPDPVRSRAAIQTVETIEAEFRRHRERLHVAQVCLEKADRNYRATPKTYARCTDGLDAEWKRTTATFLAAEKRLRSTVTPDEWLRIERRLAP